jgi:amino acid transporter
LDTIERKLKETTGEEFGPFLKFILNYITPGLAAMSLVFGLFDEFSNPLNFPGWAVFFGWILMLLPVSFAIYGFTCGRYRLMATYNLEEISKAKEDKIAKKVELEAKKVDKEMDDEDVPQARVEQLKAIAVTCQPVD